MSASSSDVLRSYLLGGLAPESRDLVEKRLFSDDRILWEHLSLIEEELIDDYARGGMGGEESLRFERDFLCTGERREKLELARGLRAYVERRKAGHPGAWEWLRRPVLSPAWGLAMAATLLLALPTAAWRVATARAPRTEVSAAISPGRVRDAGGELKRVPLPPACQLVRLRLDPGAARYGRYRATLHEVGGDEVWSQSRLGAGPFEGKIAVTLTLPCDLLPAGDYYVRLGGVSPGEDPVPLDRYDFRVLRP